MVKSLELLKLEVLLAFQNESPSMCTVTGLARRFGEGKQKMSRLLQSMEKEGLVDRADSRRPQLTQKGIEMAGYYGDRTDVILNHLLYEGVDLESAEHDSVAWALYTSDAGMKMLRDSEQRYRAKYELRRQASFDGGRLCEHLKDGEYRFAFIIYREHVLDGNNISMANGGFEHPCVLSIKDGYGTIFLKPVEIENKSPMTGREMTGRVRDLCYMENGIFKPASEKNGMLSFPAGTLSFINMGSGIGQIMHGSVCLKMQCSVGTVHMPESMAIFTMMI